MAVSGHVTAGIFLLWTRWNVYVYRSVVKMVCNFVFLTTNILLSIKRRYVTYVKRAMTDYLCFNI